MKIIISEQQAANMVLGFKQEFDEEYPVGWNIETFKNLRSYNARIQYCQQNLKRISSGSSRIVYMVDNTKVLKLAKNPKGIVQNETEIQWKDDGYFGGILAKIFDYDQDKSLWVEMELARKISPSTFQRLVGVSLNDYEHYITAKINEFNGKRGFMNYPQDEKIIEILNESEFVNNIIDFIMNTDSIVGDFGKLSSYGLVLRDNQESIVLIDFGLTEDDFNTLYRKR